MADAGDVNQYGVQIVVVPRLQLREASLGNGIRISLSRMVGSRFSLCATIAFWLTRSAFCLTVTVTALSGYACALRKLLRTARANSSS